jgi:hypothetical protein
LILVMVGTVISFIFLFALLRTLHTQYSISLRTGDSGLPSAAPTFPLVSPTLRFFRTWIPRSQPLLFFPLFSSLFNSFTHSALSLLLFGSSLYSHFILPFFYLSLCGRQVLRFVFRFAVHLPFFSGERLLFQTRATTEVRLRIDTRQ